VRSFKFLLSRRWVLFFLAVVVLAYGTWWLGEWQFHRLESRRHTNTVVRTNEAMAPVPVAQLLSTARTPDASIEWRRVTATGHYDAADTYVWRYLTDDESDPGVDEVVPFVTTSGTTLLVDRGWVSSNDPTRLPANAPAPPAGQVTVVGWVRQNGTGDSTVVAQQGFRALSSVTLGPAIHQTVYGGFVNLQTENGATPANLGQVDLPQLNDGPHFFYGVQWWFFGVLAIVGFFYLLYDEWLTLGKAEAGDEEGAKRLAERQANQADRKQRTATKVRQRQAVRAAYKAAYEKEKAENSR